ncbi:MAG: DUF2520 domain-containing protein [Desulfamplus sp.]|nr:DUF2520 domain-containing protein [Desulfamplus sp.]
MTPKKIAIIGCGRVGTSLAVFLSKAGYNIAGVASRTFSSAQRTVQAILSIKGIGGNNSKEDTNNSNNITFYEDVKLCILPAEAAILGDIIFITTPDNLIQNVCFEISSNPLVNISEKTIFHCSGALSSCVLASASDKGANTGSIHPLQSFAPYTLGQNSPFVGINVSVEGSEKALIIGKELVASLGANYFTIPTKSKTLYHAAAVVASNYLVTLENCALELLKEANLSEDKAYTILEPLIQGTLNNIKTRGTIAALTGPVARGDSAIVEKHLKDIDEVLPNFSKLYRLMGEYTLKLAQKRGELEQGSIDRLSEVFNK